MPPEATTTQQNPWKRRVIVGVPLALGIAALLVACGGGTSERNQQTAQSASATTSEADGTAKALAVPPGWVGRPPASEVINGITVPPEPAPSINNATLAGVDSNRNGVRDDVERKIARLSRSPAEGATILLGAAAYQRLVLLPNSPEPTRMQLLQIFSDVTCSQWAVAQARGVYDKSLVYERDLLLATLNTPERIADFEVKLQNFSGYLGTELRSCN